MRLERYLDNLFAARPTPRIWFCASHGDSLRRELGLSKPRLQKNYVGFIRRFKSFLENNLDDEGLILRITYAGNVQELANWYARAVETLKVVDDGQ
jgi:hypothetical protein